MDDRWRSRMRRLAAVAILVPVALATLGGAPYAVIVVLGVAAFATFLVLQPAAAIVLFVLVRGLADLVSENRFALGPLELNLASVLGIAMIAGTIPLAAIRIRARRFRLPPGGIWFTGFIAVAAAGVAVGWARLGGEGLRLGLREWVRLASVFAFFIAATQAFEDPRRARILEGGIILSIGIAAALGLVQVIAGGGIEDPSTGTLRATGPFAFANPLAFAILLAWNRSVARAAARVAKAWEYALGAILLAAFAATKSLTGLALLPLSLPFLAVGRRRWIAIAGIAVILAACIAIPGTRHRIEGIVRSVAGSEAAADDTSASGGNSLSWRIRTWRAILPACGTHPVLGWGLKNSLSLRANPRAHWADPERGVEPHNDYLRFLFEGGALGLAAFLAFHAGVLAALDRLRRRLAGAAWGPEARALEVSYAALLAGAFFTNYTDFTALLVYVFGLVAAVTAGGEAEFPPGRPS
ncbi:MAG: O-antigen ligase family protein [Planctomycetes bacterium]|nr:O-antigen ligase family protein [Planctomycetota bacterium]